MQIKATGSSLRMLIMAEAYDRRLRSIYESLETRQWKVGSARPVFRQADHA